LQSDRFTILAGPCEEVFRISEDLLTQCSPFFEKSCSLPFQELGQRVIKLPDDNPITFEHFFLWLHNLIPYIPLNDDYKPLANLGIFAEKYHIRLLMNQISNLIRTAVGESRWKPSPDIMKTVYGSVPANSNLRRLCSLAFTINFNKRGSCIDINIWKSTFNDFSEFGWDYFQRVQMGQTSTTHVTLDGVCRFHDHSDVFGWVRGESHTCPYPDGAPVTVPKEKKILAVDPAPELSLKEPYGLDREHGHAEDRCKSTTELDPGESDEANLMTATLDPKSSHTASRS